MARKIKLSKTQENMKRIDKLACERKKFLKKNPTRAELEFKKILQKYNIQFGFQKIIYTPHNFFIVDFIIGMKPRNIIEIDGDSHKEKEEYDRKREYLISKTRYKKYNFLRIKNEQVFNGEAERIIIRVYSTKYKKWLKKNRNLP